MLRYVEGDLLNSPAQVIVNTVNTVGVMGKGIALEFKKNAIRKCVTTIRKCVINII